MEFSEIHPITLRRKISHNVKENIDYLSLYIGGNVDIVNRDFTLSNKQSIQCAIFFVDGLTNTEVVESTIIEPLLLHVNNLGTTNADAEKISEKIKDSLVLNPSVVSVRYLDEAYDKMLCGDTILFLDYYNEALIVSTRAWDTRAVGEPETEPVVRGARDGFVENIRTNTALIRRRIRDPYLRVEGLTVGTRSKTDVNIVYIQDVVKPGVVDELRKRLNQIEIDAILESGYIEEFIEDAPLSPFTTVQNTERPDKVASAILEGRVAILVDNTPFSLLVPSTFWQFLQASDDYYSHYWMGSFFRLIRYLAFAISLTLPSLYVLLVTFHQEMLPTELAIAVAAGRENIPFPALIEALMMEISFELMRESGIRMPKQIGSAVSILGSLVIGQAAVEAGILSPLMVIIIALTGIASYAIPNYSAAFAIRLLRFPLLLASGLFGLLGFSVVLIVIMLHAISLRSFGEPYFAPLANYRAKEMKDFMLRKPWWKMNNRPFTSQQDPDRQGEKQKPGKPMG